MVKKLSYLSSLFSKTGTPIYWSPEHLIEIGLQDGHELNWTKLNYLNEIGYQKTAELIPVIPYKFYFYIKNENNQTLFEFGVLPQNAKNILIIDRFGILNQTFVNIRGIVWD
ncbi:MAG: hypothetical protein QMD14_01335 [Candidatus Aenigmarchaeota archaeon]|nr:hypothetical protein [Candidatus Aenigmarchaeota archaeon]